MSTQLTKRAIEVNFPDGPSVDLIVGLTRKDAAGLWIPNLHSSSWDASHPERHTELLTAAPKALRVTRARAIRLGEGVEQAADAARPMQLQHRSACA